MLSERKVDIGEIEDAGEEDESDETDWVTWACSGNAKVRVRKAKRGRASFAGTVTCIIRLCGSEDAAEQDPGWPWLNQACLIMGWHKNDDFWYLENFEPANVANVHHRGDGLWAWQDADDKGDYAFFFALPIFALRDEGELKRLALTPLKVLFEADDPRAAAAAAFNGVPVLQPEET